MIRVGGPLPQKRCPGLNLQLLVFYPAAITVVRLRQRRDCLDGWAGNPISTVPSSVACRSCSLVSKDWEALRGAAETRGHRSSLRAPPGKPSD